MAAHWPAWTLRWDGLVDAVEPGAVELADEMLRRSGAVCPPTVHLLFKHLPQPYLGSVATRPFRRGSDAAAVVAALGVLPSVVHATRLVVVWEYSDLCAALDLPGCREGRYPLGPVVLDADLAEHVVRWHPFHMRTDATSDPAVPLTASASIWPEWGAAVRHPGVELPGPVAELLTVWRELPRVDVAATRADLGGGRVRRQLDLRSRPASTGRLRARGSGRPPRLRSCWRRRWSSRCRRKTSG